MHSEQPNGSNTLAVLCGPTSRLITLLLLFICVLGLVYALAIIPSHAAAGSSSSTLPHINYSAHAVTRASRNVRKPAQQTWVPTQGIDPATTCPAHLAVAMDSRLWSRSHHLCHHLSFLLQERPANDLPNMIQTGQLTYFKTRRQAQWGGKKVQAQTHMHYLPHLSLSKVWQHNNAPASMCFLAASRKVIGAISVGGFDWLLLLRRSLLELVS